MRAISAGWLVAIMVGTAVGPTVVVAQQDTVRLDPLTVTTRRGGERRASDAPVSVTVLTRAQILASPALSAAELLRGIPGLQIPLLDAAQNFPLNPSVAIRGLGLGDNATRTLVLLDGVPMNGPMFGSVYWSRIPIDEIERVEIVRGGSSSGYGSFAMGGVVNIITRRPGSDEVALSGRGGSLGTFQGHLSANHRFSPVVSGGFDAGYTRSDGYVVVSPADRGPIDDPSAMKAFDFRAILGFDVAPGTTGSVRLGVMSDDHDGLTKLSRNAIDLWDLAAGLSQQVGGAGVLDLTGFFLHERTETSNTSSNPFGSRNAEYLSNRHETPSTDAGISAAYRRVVSPVLPNLTFGFDARRLRGSDVADIFNSANTKVIDRLGEGTQLSTGLFAEMSVQPVSGLLLEAGLRGDRFATSSGRLVENGSDTSFDDKVFSRVSLRAAGRVSLTPTLAVRGSIGNAFRAPTLAELYRTFGTSTFIGLANPALDPERSTGGDLGLDLHHDRVSAQLTGFQTTVKDAIGGAFVLDDPFTIQNANIGALRARGFEANLDVRASRLLTLGVNYTYTEATVTENSDDPSLVGNTSEGVPKHAFAASLSVRSAGVRVSVQGRYLGDQFQDITNQALLPAHGVLDATAGVRVGRNLELIATGQNLLGEDYVASAFGEVSQLGAPRQVSIGFRLWKTRT